MLQCSRCDENKPAEDFAVATRNKRGRAFACKECMSDFMRDKNNPISVEVKMCTNCKLLKSFRKFNRDKRRQDGLSVSCRACNRDRYLSTPRYCPTDETKVCPRCREEKNTSDFHRNKRNKDGLVNTCKKCVKVTRVLVRFNLSEDEYNTMQNTQKGVCPSCLGFFGEFLVIDHCHDTGAVRALLCQICNKMEGMLRKNRPDLNGLFWKSVLENLEEMKWEL